MADNYGNANNSDQAGYENSDDGLEQENTVILTSTRMDDTILWTVTVIVSLAIIFLIPFCVAVREKYKKRRHELKFGVGDGMLLRRKRRQNNNNNYPLLDSPNSATTTGTWDIVTTTTRTTRSQDENQIVAGSSSSSSSPGNGRNVLLRIIFSDRFKQRARQRQAASPQSFEQKSLDDNDSDDDGDNSDDENDTNTYYGLGFTNDPTFPTDSFSSSFGSPNDQDNNNNKSNDNSWLWSIVGRPRRFRQPRVQGAAKVLHSSLPSSPAIIAVDISATKSSSSSFQEPILLTDPTEKSTLPDSATHIPTPSSSSPPSSPTASPPPQKPSRQHRSASKALPLQDDDGISLQHHVTTRTPSGGRSRSPTRSRQPSPMRTSRNASTRTPSPSRKSRNANTIIRTPSPGRTKYRTPSPSRTGHTAGRTPSPSRRNHHNMPPRTASPTRRISRKDPVRVFDPSKAKHANLNSHEKSHEPGGNNKSNNSNSNMYRYQKDDKDEPARLMPLQEQSVHEMQVLAENDNGQKSQSHSNEQFLMSQQNHQTQSSVHSIISTDVLGQIDQALEKDLAFDFEEEQNSQGSLREDEKEELNDFLPITSYETKDVEEEGRHVLPTSTSSGVDKNENFVGTVVNNEEYVQFLDEAAAGNARSVSPSTAASQASTQHHRQQQQLCDQPHLATPSTDGASSAYYRFTEPPINISNKDYDFIPKVDVDVCCGKRPWWRFLCSRRFRRKVAKCASWDNEMKSLLKLAVPFALQTMSSHLFGLIEVALIGRLLGAQTLAAYYALGLIFSLACMPMEGVHSSLYTLCSHAIRAEKYDLAGQMVQIAILFYQFLLIPMAIIVFHYTEDIILWLGFNEEVSDIASSYARVKLVSTFIHPIDEALHYLLEVSGHEVYCATMSLLGSIASVISILVAILVVPNISLFGIGVVHLILEVVFLLLNVAVILCMKWFDGYWSTIVGRLAFTDVRVVRVFLKQAIPLSLGYIMSYAEWEVLFIFAGFMGPAYVAVWGLVGDLWKALQAVGLATSDASEIRVSNLLGSNQPNRARYYAHKSLLVSVVVAIFCSLPIYFLSSKIPAWFTKDETMQYLFEELVPYMCIGNVTMMFGSVTWTLLGAQGRYGLATAMGFVGSWGVTLPLSAIFTYGLGSDLPGLASAVVIGNACSGSLNSFFLVRSNWEKLSKIQQKNKEERDKWNENKPQDATTLPFAINYGDLAWNKLPENVQIGAKSLGFTQNTTWDKGRELPCSRPIHGNT
ncbi:hypothetical protein ACA910_019318 [Epithemia clementina (nom. ined.)]